MKTKLILIIIILISNIKLIHCQSLMSIKSEITTETNTPPTLQTEELNINLTFPQFDSAQYEIYLYPIRSDLDMLDKLRKSASEKDKKTIDFLRKSIAEKNKQLANFLRKEESEYLIQRTADLNKLDSLLKVNDLSLEKDRQASLKNKENSNYSKCDSLLMSLRKQNDFLQSHSKLIHKNLAVLKTMIDSITGPKIDSIGRYTYRIEQQRKIIAEQFKLFYFTFETYMAYHNTILKEVQSLSPVKKKQDNKIDYQAAPDVTGLIGESIVIPTISLIGHINFFERNTFSEIKVFNGTPLQNNSDSLQKSRINLLIPTACNFGIIGSFAYYIDSTSRFGLFSQYSFRRNQVYINGLSATVSSLNIRLGFEYEIFPNYVSVYGNVSGFAPVVNNSWFRTNTSLTKDVVFTPDFGAKFFMKSTENLGFTLDLNFIGVTSEARKVTGIDDHLIPSIRIGLVHEIRKKK